MTHEQFNAFVDERTDHIKDLLQTKGDEYNRSEDRLEFFKRSANVLGCTSEAALLGFMSKHIVSLIEYIRKNEVHDYKVYEEKATDIINYLILLLALIKEEQENKQ